MSAVKTLLLLLCCLVSACAQAPLAQPDMPVLRDQLFAPASEPIESQDLFTLSAPMKRFLEHEVAARVRAKGLYRGLYEALFTDGELKLRYDAARTRSAAQAFEARSGNCLSLVIMTAAFAKELGIAVEFNRVLVDESWARRGDIYFASGHVNLTLGHTFRGGRSGVFAVLPMTIDFLPPEETRGIYRHQIDEATVVAMYLNNRAAESLAQGGIDDAYWWAREAVSRVPGFLPSYNTLAAVYRQHGNLAESERVLRQLLSVDPANAYALSNLAGLLKQLGRDAEAQVVAGRLNQLESQPPFHFLKLGRDALARGDFAQARDHFWREIKRTGDYHESYLGLAAAELGLGNADKARKHLAAALEFSLTGDERDLYAAKLARLNAAQRH
jgi:tetratricopeptide (TPR) repeat protein